MARSNQAMRTVTFNLLSPRGDVITPATGTVAELVREIPYLLAFDTVPPLGLLNSILASGREDAGLSGGCMWEPFELTEEEYKEMCAGLAADGYHLVTPAEWVQTREAWIIYLDEVWNGMPAGEMRELHSELAALEQAWQQLEAAGDVEGALELKLQAMEISAAMSEQRSAHGWNHDWKRKEE
jgi:hypothetical protein